MSLWIIIPFVLFELAHVVLTLFLLLALGGLGKQQGATAAVILMIAKQCDVNFDSLKTAVNGVVLFINHTFEDADTKPVTTQKIDKTFKN
jgi:hypothetical protein